MTVLLSCVVAILAVPIICSLRQLERNTAQLITTTRKFELYIDAIKKIN